MDQKPRYKVYRPNAMFNTLRRLHGQNLENQGLNNLTEAFQNFMTRTRFLTTGNLRRTWSHGAVEFMKYRRLLPMIVADENDIGSAFDNFDLTDERTANLAVSSDRKIIVSNVSNRVTSSQLQAFFSKFGKVQSCNFPYEDRRQSMYATLPKQSKKSLTVTITFKSAESALRAKEAGPEELAFYGTKMLVSSYVSTSSRRRTTSNQGGDNPIVFASSSKQPDNLSRPSSALSVSSTGTLSSQVFPLDELPPRALEIIFKHLGPIDRIRLERTNKTWLEAAAKAWARCEFLSFSEDTDLKSFFTSSNPLRNTHLTAFLFRCAVNLKSLDLSNTANLLDDKAVEQIGQLCLNLEELDISGVHASADALRVLSESLSRLKRVAYREMESASESCFWYLFKNLGLKCVDLRGCYKLRGRCFKLFSVELEELLLDGCTQISTEAIEDICNRCRNIKVLSLNGCYALTDQSINLISRHLTSLERLSLAGEHFDSITPDGLMSVLRLQTLTHLDFDFNPAVHSEVIHTIATNLSNTLISLSLAFSGSDSTIDSGSICALAKLNELKELDLSGLAAVNNDTLRSICGGCSKINKITTRSCIYLGDDGVQAIDRLERIELIDISGCILVTRNAVQHLINEFSLQKQPDGHSITLCIGGTVCEPQMVRCRNTRINLDFEDYSALSLETAKKFIRSFGGLDVSNDELDVSDDSFGMLSAHRSFVADALTAEEDLPVDTSDKSMLEWAEREAKNLGLLEK